LTHKLGKHGLTNAELDEKIIRIKAMRGDNISARQISNFLRIWCDKDVHFNRILEREKFIR
jgi:hypothetical protein